MAAAHNSLPENDPIEDATTGYAGDGGPAADALLFAEVGQQADPSSKLTYANDVLYIADSGNNIIRTIDLTTMTIDRLAGVPWTRDSEDDLIEPADLTAGDGGPALDAVLNNPRDVAVGLAGEVYIADTDNHCVRVVHPDGTIDTFAGTCGAAPQPGDAFKGENQPAVNALLWSPYGIEVDNYGHVYIADTKNHVIRRVAVGEAE
jgi:serine/threonine-protein kinase